MAIKMDYFDIGEWKGILLRRYEYFFEWIDGCMEVFVVVWMIWKEQGCLRYTPYAETEALESEKNWLLTARLWSVHLACALCDWVVENECFTLQF